MEIIIIIIIIIIKRNKKNKEKRKYEIPYGNFTTKSRIMTRTELQFYNELKQIVKKYNYEIFTQVALNRIIESNNKTGLNQIGAKSIDFVITDKYGNIKICIELDDYTHKREERIERDNLVNAIFQKANKKLLRIPIEQAFTVERIEKMIKESL